MNPLYANLIRNSTRELIDEHKAIVAEKIEKVEITETRFRCRVCNGTHVTVALALICYGSHKRPAPAEINEDR